MRTQTEDPSPPWFVLALACFALAFSLYCNFLALKFRLSLESGSEADIAVGILVVLGAPLLVAPSIALWFRRSSRGIVVFLVAPPVLGIIAICIASIGVSVRP